MASGKIVCVSLRRTLCVCARARVCVLRELTRKRERGERLMHDVCGESEGSGERGGDQRTRECEPSSLSPSI